MFVLLAMACNPEVGGNFLDSNIRCDNDVFGWFDDLALYVDRGEPKEGAEATYAWDFDYEPANVRSVKGSYSTRSGNFDYTVEYTNDSYMVSKRTIAEFGNYGTVYTNGNLDVRAKITEEDVLGNTVTYVRRDERMGCKGWIKYRWEEDDGSLPRYPQYEVAYDIVSDDKVEWSAETEVGSGIESAWGQWTSELAYVRNVSYDGDTIAYDSWSRTNSKGEETQEWSQVHKDSNYVYIGTTDVAKNGFTVEDYTVAEGSEEPYADVHTERNYDGSGTGLWTFSDGTTCDLTYGADDSCVYTCSDGDSGDC
ncbi:MAG TPA: hypothetical protein QGF58_05790 [Myxococcota bacterium]|nr:hypothetical protein [Myxococcota bacterium]